jgi:hypothetical protein
MTQESWREEVERDLQVLGMRRWRELVIDREKWRGIFRQAKSPQRAVGPMEEEEQEGIIKISSYFIFARKFKGNGMNTINFISLWYRTSK